MTREVNGAAEEPEDGIARVSERHGPLLEGIANSGGWVAVLTLPRCIGQIPGAVVEVDSEVDATVSIELEGIGLADNRGRAVWMELDGGMPSVTAPLNLPRYPRFAP